MKKRLAIGLGSLVAVIFGVLAALYAGTPSSLQDTTAAGIVIRSQTWSGTITITGDVYFAPWATLIITPGAAVRFEKRTDVDIEATGWTKWADEYIKDNDDPTGRDGYKQAHFHIHGRIVAIGTAAEPIVFTSAQAEPEYADWDQLSLAGGSVLDYVRVSYAHNGVTINGSNVQVTNSVIHDSLWSCVDVFATGVRVSRNEIYHCWHQAVGTKVTGEIVIEDNDIQDANLGVNCEYGSRPTLVNNRFAAAPVSPDCGQGTGNSIEERPADSDGGTFGGRLIYPAQP
jgi:hypothetical protein